MPRADDPITPDDSQLLPAFVQHFTITVVCACGHSRVIYARPIQRQLGAGVSIGRVRDCLRCHKCQKRRPTITVQREPR